jgi:hypothetical protein
MKGQPIWKSWESLSRSALPERSEGKRREG